MVDENKTTVPVTSRMIMRGAIACSQWRNGKKLDKPFWEHLAPNEKMAYTNQAAACLEAALNGDNEHKPQRRIICAAIRKTISDKVYVIPGPRHWDMTMHNLVELFFGDVQWPDAEQGFLDQHGVFYNRKEALEIALAANQLIRKTQPADELFSEDLY